MSCPKVWIADEMSERAVEVFRSHGIEVDDKPSLFVDEQVKIAGNYDGIAVRSSTTLKADLLASEPQIHQTTALIRVRKWKICIDRHGAYR